MSEHSTEPVVQGQTVADDKLRAATGRTRQEWHSILNEAGAGDWSHTAIAKWLVADQGVDGWWAQGITVGYEHARGSRQPGQQADGTFAVSATKTVRAPKAQALQAIVEAVTAELGDPVSMSPDVKFATARWMDGEERVLATVSQPKPDRALIALDRSRMVAPATGESKAGLRRWLDAAAEALG
ncbi:MAG TPA: hypothetical protein PK781_11920 [Terrimesophilobacter sp.]|nr:hypothetical protein [Terrimesophilobacter sp.]